MRPKDGGADGDRGAAADVRGRDRLIVQRVDHSM